MFPVWQHSSSPVVASAFARRQLAKYALAQAIVSQAVVPGCQPGSMAVLARHLRMHGWSWDEELLLTVVGHLEAEGICTVRDLVCLDLSDVPHAVTWSPEVRAHVLKLVSSWPVRVTGCLHVLVCVVRPSVHRETCSKGVSLKCLGSPLPQHSSVQSARMSSLKS